MNIIQESNLVKVTVPDGQRQRVEYRVIPAIGLCKCGREVTLAKERNPCACGITYSAYGRVLAFQITPAPAGVAL